MPKLDSLSDVGIFTRDSKKAKAFYTKTIGLKVRSEDKKTGYIALGATKGGEDAALNLWQPAESWGPEMYAAGTKQIGTVTGVGFSTTDLKRTANQLKRRGVKVEMEGESADFARFSDPDGNVLFLQEPPRPKVRRAGLQRLEFVTVVSQDAAKAGLFFTKGLGMKGKKVQGTEGEGFTVYRLSPRGTSIMPFAPTREMYENPADYDADLAHLGENTSIGFATRDIQGVQQALLARGVRFSKKAEKQPWGGWSARFLDADDNIYSIVQMD